MIEKPQIANIEHYRHLHNNYRAHTVKIAGK
jgi:hypothetical protein